MRKTKLQSLMTINWSNALFDYFQTESFKTLALKLKQDRSRTEVYPLKENIFRVFKETDLEDIQVVIWGQD